MTPILTTHVALGALSILAGTLAISFRKGGEAHRVLGTVFVLAMLIMSAAGIYLAAIMPSTSVVPPGPTAIVGAFTFYLVGSSWLTVARRPGEIGLLERGGLVAALGAAIGLLALGAAVALSPKPAPPPGVAPYFVFAALTTIAATGDLNLIRRRRLTGINRIARHLWRMCLALFFATSFFFIGQQKVMPAYLHRSPVLLVLGLAPLALLLYWLVAVRVMKRFSSQA